VVVELDEVVGGRDHEHHHAGHHDRDQHLHDHHAVTTADHVPAQPLPLTSAFPEPDPLTDLPRLLPASRSCSDCSC
jgi:hypothetical protein